MTTGQKIGGGIVAFIAFVTAAYFTYTGVIKEPETENQKVAVATNQSLNISTEGEVPLTFKLYTSAVDVQYAKQPAQGIERNMLDSVWVAQQKALNFGGWWIMSDGSIAHNWHVVLPPAKGSGYNGRVSDFPNPSAFKAWGNGVLDQPWPSDWLTKTIQSANAIGIPMGVTLNKRDSWAANKIRIDSTDAEFIMLWSEVKLIKTETPQSYLPWARQMRDSISKYYGLYSATNPTGKKLIADEPNLNQDNRESQEWRRDVNPTSLSGIYGGDDYRQIYDELLNVGMGFTKNQDSNVSKVKYYFDSIFPAQISEFQTLFPGWFVLGGQCQVVDNRPEAETVQFINKSIVGVLALGGFYESWVKNQAIQPVCIYQSLKTLNDPLDNNTQIMKRLNPLLNPARKVTTLTLQGMDGCSGWSAHEGKSHWVQINNYTLNTYTLSSVNVNNKPKTPMFTCVSHTADNWNADVRIDSTTAESYTIKPGVTVLSFTLKSGQD